MQHTLLGSSIRALFISLFAIIGIGAGFICLILFFNLIGGEDNLEPDTKYSPKLVANAKGVRKELASTAPVILMIDINGMIGLEGLNMESIHEQLLESREGILKNNRVKALLLRINSPGGTVVDSDSIYRAIKAYKERYQVPVYAYADGLCASGALFIAASADQLYASESSLIGSIGVVSPPFMNVSKLLEKLGVDSLTLSAGKGKDELNPFRPWKPDEDENMRKIIADYYKDFVDVIVIGRKMDRQKLVDEIGANVYVAAQAEEIGLIDKSGLQLDEVIALLVKQLGIEDDFYQVVRLHSKLWFSNLFARRADAFQMTHQIDLPGIVPPKLAHQFLYLYMP